MGSEVVASLPAHLCDSETHLVNVTIAGNLTLLEVDGQGGQVELGGEGPAVPELSSPASVFLGGLPGEPAPPTWVLQVLGLNPLLLRVEKV